MNKSILLIVFAFVSLGLISCGDSGVSCDDLVQSGGLAFNAEIQAFTDAAIAYSIDQSDENCQKYISSLRAYIDAVKDVQSCANEVGQGEEFAQSIREAEADLSDLSCN